VKKKLSTGRLDSRSKNISRIGKTFFFFGKKYHSILLYDLYFKSFSILKLTCVSILKEVISLISKPMIHKQIEPNGIKILFFWESSKHPCWIVTHRSLHFSRLLLSFILTWIIVLKPGYKWGMANYKNSFQVLSLC